MPAPSSLFCAIVASREVFEHLSRNVAFVRRIVPLEEQQHVCGRLELKRLRVGHRVADLDERSDADLLDSVLQVPAPAAIEQDLDRVRTQAAQQERAEELRGIASLRIDEAGVNDPQRQGRRRRAGRQPDEILRVVPVHDRDHGQAIEPRTVFKGGEVLRSGSGCLLAVESGERLSMSDRAAADELDKPDHAWYWREQDHRSQEQPEVLRPGDGCVRDKEQGYIEQPSLDPNQPHHGGDEPGIGRLNENDNREQP